MTKALIIRPNDGDNAIIGGYSKKNSYNIIKAALDGGYIECVPFSVVQPMETEDEYGEFAVQEFHYHMYIDEEGKLKELPFNYHATDMVAQSGAIFMFDGIVGPAIILSGELDDDGVERGLTTDEIAVLLNTFGLVAVKP